jgi:hypothetical protein
LNEEEPANWAGVISINDHYVFGVIEKTELWLKCTIYDSLNRYILPCVYKQALSKALHCEVRVLIIALNWQNQSKSMWAVNSCGIYACLIEWIYVKLGCKNPENEDPIPSEYLKLAREYISQFNE